MRAEKNIKKSLWLQRNIALPVIFFAVFFNKINNLSCVIKIVKKPEFLKFFRLTVDWIRYHNPLGLSDRNPTADLCTEDGKRG